MKPKDIPFAMMNIPKHTKCTNCGACCGVIPASVQEVLTIRNYIAQNGISPIEQPSKTICPFRDEEHKKCMIYPVRPIVCRLMGVSSGMQCPNGNTTEIDGAKCLIDGAIRILNFEKW